VPTGLSRPDASGDPTTPYMYHCHVLRHADNGMMGKFTVVEADDVDTAPSRKDTHARTANSAATSARTSPM
jgi:hypothetical protein